MRILVTATFLIFNSFAVFAADPLSNAQYASIIADVFVRLKEPDHFKKFMRLKTRAEDIKLLETEMVELNSLPHATAKGSSIQLDFGGVFETVTVLDVTKALYRFKGVEVDLSPNRPLRERLDQIERLINGSGSATFWAVAFPAAQARGKILSSIAVAATGVAGASAVDFQNFMDAGLAVSRLIWVCEAIKSGNTKFRGVFSARGNSRDSIENQIDFDERWKHNKLVRGVTNWQPSVRETLIRNKTKYCQYDRWYKSLWHEVRKLNFRNYTSENREETCEEIKTAIACYTALAQKKEPAIYQIQHEQIVKWLKVIDPSVSETQITREIRIERTPRGATR